MKYRREAKPKPVPAVPEAVKIAAIDAMAQEAPRVSKRLQGIHREAAIIRAVLRKAAAYAAIAKVSEAALVEYLKGRL
jgi:hypothetical protein